MPLMLGADHMSSSRRYEVQRTNNFEVVLEDLSDDFTLAVESTSIPVISNEPIELAYGNSRVKVAGQIAYEDVSIVCKDFIVADAEQELWNWRKQVGDPSTNSVGWAYQYKRSGKLYQYAPDGTCVRAWKLEGVWPTSFESGEFNYDGSDKKLITLNLAIDKAYPIRD